MANLCLFCETVTETTSDFEQNEVTLEGLLDRYHSLYFIEELRIDLHNEFRDPPKTWSALRCHTRMRHKKETQCLIPSVQH